MVQLQGHVQYLQYFLHHSDLDRRMPESQHRPAVPNGLRQGGSGNVRVFTSCPPALHRRFACSAWVPWELLEYRGEGEKCNEKGKSERVSQDSGKRVPKEMTLLV